MNEFLNDRYQVVLYQELSMIIAQTNELNLISVLKPKLTKDGKSWCYLLGENLQEGVCGFGDTPYKAALDFRKNYYTEKIEVQK